jgi:Fic family protein
MHSFKPEILDSLTSHEISRALGVIHEARGKQEMYETQKPEVLKNLKQVAIIESTESSNRLEGAIAPQDVMDKIIESGKPLDASNRSEAEIAGYRNVLNRLHDNALNIPLTSDVILQLHRDLMGHTSEGGGYWKKLQNHITEELPDGTRCPRARTTEPYLVEKQMSSLVQKYQDYLDDEKIDPLLLMALFVLDFLCIHPFSDGNGRMVRLLTVLLLYHHNYRMVRYISLERIIEETKESYYETLKQSDRGWHEDGGHCPMPWVGYFLSVLVKASNEFTSKLDAVSSGYGMKRAFVITAVDEMVGLFSISELGRKCPTVGRDTLRTTLRKLKEQGYLEGSGRGRNARWQKTKKPLPRPTSQREG